MNHLAVLGRDAAHLVVHRQRAGEAAVVVESRGAVVSGRAVDDVDVDVAGSVRVCLGRSCCFRSTSSCLGKLQVGMRASRLVESQPECC